MSDPIASLQAADPNVQATSDSHNVPVPNPSVRLRDRERLQATQPYGTSLESAQMQQIDKVKRQRSGKKRSISLRISQINRILFERGSRTKVTYLRDKLQEAYNDILEVNENLMQLLEPEDKDYGNDYVEEIGIQVDECCAEVESYLVDRMNDPPSTSPSSCSDLNSEAGSSHSSKSGAYSLDKASKLPTTVKQEAVVRWMEEETTAEQNEFSSANYTQERMDAMLRKYNTKFVTRYDENQELATESTPMNLASNVRQSSDSTRLQHTSRIPESESVPHVSLQHVPEFVPRVSPRHAPDFALSTSVPEFVPRTSASELSPGISAQPAPCVPMRPVSTLHHVSELCPSTSAAHVSVLAPYSLVPGALVDSCTSTTAIESARIAEHSSSMPTPGLYVPTTGHKVPVDAWIDTLNPLAEPFTTGPSVAAATSVDVTMQWLVHQQLPKLEVPIFDGSPIKWIDFIVKFKDMVHDKLPLSWAQRRSYLVQHLSGEPKLSIEAFNNDYNGYVLTLKRLKYMYGQRVKIAQCHISKVTKGKQIYNDDANGLARFYFAITDCLVNLERMCYYSDLYSTDVLRQAIARLPTYLQRKWSEHSHRIHKIEEPNLKHLEIWLQERIMASRDPYIPAKESKGKTGKEKEKERDKLTTLTTTNAQGKSSKGTNSSGASANKSTKSVTCAFCKKNHRITRCDKFKGKTVPERMKFAISSKLCQRCLGQHEMKDCPSTRTCFVDGCNKKHNTLLHSNSPTVHFNEEENTHVGVAKQKKQGTFLQVVPVKTFGKENEEVTYALIDGGSQVTLVLEDLADDLSLQGDVTTVDLGSIKDSGEPIEAKRVSIEFSPLRTMNLPFKASNALVVKKEYFHVPSQRLPHDFTTNPKYGYLQNLGLKDVDASQIKLLIGADVPEATIATKIVMQKGSPSAVLTPFGWTICGPNGDSSRKGISLSTNCLYLSHEEALTRNLKDFLAIDSFGINEDPEETFSINERKILQHMEGSTQKLKGHYQMPMLWKPDCPNLPNNYILAKKRYSSLNKRLQKDKSLHEKYTSTINSYLEKGLARMTLVSDPAGDETWYLPHHPVFHPKKKDKMRVVFDAAAKYQGSSLNDQLHKGPDLLNSLAGVLIRFREHRYTIVADIEAMFHQIFLASNDSKYMRFLWNPDLDKPPEVYEMHVHIFGARDSPCCANFALQKSARDNSSEFSNLTIQTIFRNFYVDDLLKSCRTIEEGRTLARELVDLLKMSGFRLTKFSSNSDEVLDSLPPSEVSSSPSSIQFNPESFERALGIRWDIRSDEFSFATIQRKGEATKRNVLRILSSVFDPLGFLNPFTLTIKKLLQSLWKHKLGWDEEIPDFAKQIWYDWLKELTRIDEFKMARCYTTETTDVTDYQLHMFSDASEDAYGTAAYLRQEHESGVISCSLVMSKNRLAPLKLITVPRLELQAAVLASRLKTSLTKEFDININATYFWSDSMITLQYINNERRRFKTFVANRVSEIHRSSSAMDWRFVEGTENPADDGTRGMTLQELIKCKRWFHGPDFLYKDKAAWSRPIEVGELGDCDEFRKSVFVTAVKLNDEFHISIEKYSSLTRLLRVTAWCIRFIRNCRDRLTLRSQASQYLLSKGDINQATTILVRHVQKCEFPEEYGALFSGKDIPKGSSIVNLNPFLDLKKVLRVGGRLRNASIPYAAKHQLILPKKHHLSDLFIRDEHLSNAHAGAEYTLASLRQSVWIVGCRSRIKAIIRQCLHCKISRVKPRPTIMADLPLCRVTASSPPFFHTGVDFFGPLLVKVLRSKAKRWGCIFSCMSTRATHLEVAESLSTDSFINVLRRFVSRRGQPEFLYSDCGTNFKGADKELTECLKELNQSQIEQWTQRKGINWKFNPPEAPHMGGAWERMIRTVKIALKAILRDQVVNDFHLMTVLAEVEAIVNCRPLTAVSDDISDLEALTPNHFLLGRATQCLPISIVYDGDECHRKRWRYVQWLADHFWRRWKREYLPELTRRNKWQRKARLPKVGDLVLIKDTNCPRGTWPMARVIEVIPSDDGEIRIVKIRTSEGEYTRPVAKLCLLEDQEDATI